MRIKKNNRKKDSLPFLEILMITALFCVIGLIRIGCFHIPENGLSFMEEETDQHEINLTFDQKLTISKIMIFNGEKNGVMTAFAAEGEEWVKIVDGQEINRVFEWNGFDFNQDTWNVDLFIFDAYVREIVFLDGNGNPVLPNNADDYSALFDEQELYPNPPTYFEHMMFDEIYHGRTAYEFLHKTSIYENTHPPLGKTIISIGIAIFGMNPFGWRIMSLIFGTMMIPILCLFVHTLCKKRSITILSGVLLGTEFMHFTLSRIATIDIIVAFFVLCMFYGMLLFVKYESNSGLILSACASALGVATKWTAIYALAGIGFLWLIWFVMDMKKRWPVANKENMKYIACLIGKCTVLFVLLPLTVYVLSYIPFVNAYPEKGLITHAIENSISMLSYHKGVNEAHPYMSSWYSWLIDWRPLLDSYDRIGDKISTVATFLNPFTCFAGLCCIPYQIYLWIKKHNKISGILLLYYFSMLAPWIFISRTVFIYQYFICSLVLILIICYSIDQMKIKRKNSLILAAGTLSTVLFILYYPVISGYPVSESFLMLLQVLPKWTL